MCILVVAGLHPLEKKIQKTLILAFDFEAKNNTLICQNGPFFCVLAHDLEKISDNTFSLKL